MRTLQQRLARARATVRRLEQEDDAERRARIAATVAEIERTLAERKAK